MKGKKWLSALIAGVMVLVAAPLSVPVQAAGNESAVQVENLSQNAVVGKEIPFSVTTTAGDSDQGKMVQGKFVLEGPAATLQYLETADGKWYELNGDTFGPTTGFPFMNATSNFKVTFNAPGTYNYSIKVVEVANPGTVLAEVSGTVEVSTYDIAITDCGPWGADWPDAYSVGWQYLNGLTLDKVASIRVGMMDKKDRNIVEYTADAEQVAWQNANGYITGTGLSSAPFYKMDKNGNELAEGRDSDWTVTFGPGFYAWQPSLFYVEVTTNSGEVYYRTMAYEGNFECIHEFAEHVAKKAPTCTEPGNIEYWYCPECDKFFSDAALQNSITPDDTILAALGHDAVKVDAKKPTADKDGNIEYWYCKTCGKYFSDKDLTKEISKEDTILKATGSKTDKKDGVPVTGDSTNMMLWVAVLALAAGVTVYAGRKARS